MSFTSLSVIMSVIVSHIHEKSKTCISKDQRLPKLMKLVFITYLAKMFRMEKSAKQLLKTIVKLNKKGLTQASAALNSKEPNVSKILNSDQSSDEISSNNNQSDGCKDKLFKKIAQDYIKARNERIKTELYTKYYKNNSSDQFQKIDNKAPDFNMCSYHFDSNQNITYNLNNQKNDTLSLDSDNQKPPIWLKRMNLHRNQIPLSPTNISNDLYFNNKLTKDEFLKQRKSSTLLKRESIKKTDLSDSNELSDTISITVKKSKNNEKKNQILTKKVKKKVTKKYRVRKENLSLYYAYEWILAGLVLDRLFFWIYLMATILSYLATLYVFPALVQQDKNDSMIFVP